MYTLFECNYSDLGGRQEVVAGIPFYADKDRSQAQACCDDAGLLGDYDTIFLQVKTEVASK
jgi:hypothetical protein